MTDMIPSRCPAPSPGQPNWSWLSAHARAVPLVVLCLVVLAPALWMAARPAAARADQEALVVATYSYGERDREGAIRPLAAYLASQLERSPQIRIYASPSLLVEALERGEAHVAVPNLTAFLASDPSRTCAVAVADVPAEDASRYRSVWLARRETSLATLGAVARALGQLRMVLPARDSASGALIPLQALEAHSEGDVAAPLSVRYAGSHEAALEALGEAQADVGALAADIWERAPDPELVELWRSPPIPPGPILCARHAAPCAQVAEALVRAHRTAPEVQAALNAGWPEYGAASRLKPPSGDVYALRGGDSARTADDCAGPP